MMAVIKELTQRMGLAACKMKIAIVYTYNAD